MGLLAAATSFTACSSSDELTGNTGSESVDGMYMTLSIQTPKGTRTAGTPTENGTTEESFVKTGALYLYNGNSCVFKKDLADGDWATTATQDKTSSTTGKTNVIKVSVNSVSTDKTYNVYFLAGANTSAYPDPLNSSYNTFKASSNGGANYATSNAFVMFNENDKDVAADSYTIKFTDDNKVSTTPAVVKSGDTETAIKLDRVVARIDKPTIAENVTNITNDENQNKYALIKSVKYVAHAVSNLNNSSYIMQNWTGDKSTLNVNYNTTDTLYQSKADFGSKYTEYGYTSNTKFFGTQASNYCFENTTKMSDEATAMYFAMKANLKDNVESDFTDGTFYRYDGKLYTKISDIYDDVKANGSTNPFVVGGKAYTATEVLGWIKTTEGKLIDEDAVLNGSTGGNVDKNIENKTLSDFRKDFSIQVYRAGIMYYRWAITDNNYDVATDGVYNHYSVLRNSIYKLNVTKISEVGKDVPNGPDDSEIKPNYYMTVSVSVNPWVLNSTDVTLK